MYRLDDQQLFSTLGTDPQQGLSSREAAQRLEKNGPNALAQAKKITLAARFFNQFKDFMIIILLIAAVVSYVVSKDLVDSIVILIVVLLNAILGVAQESKAEKSLEALKKMSAPTQGN